MDPGRDQTYDQREICLRAQYHPRGIDHLSVQKVMPSVNQASPNFQGVKDSLIAMRSHSVQTQNPNIGSFERAIFLSGQEPEQRTGLRAEKAADQTTG